MKVMMHFKIKLYIAFLMIALSFASWAGEMTIAKVQVHHFAPWKIVEDPDRISGIDIEFLKMVLHRMDIETSFVIAPFKRGLLMMEHGDVDVMTGLLRRPEREAYIHFIDPPYKTRSNKAFYVNKGKGHLINRYEDLYQLDRIGVGDGAKYFDRFDKDDKLNKKVLAGKSATFLEKVVDMLLIDRINAFIHTESVMDYYLIKNGLQDKIEKAGFVYGRPIDVYMGISKKSPFLDRKEQFQSHLKQLMEDGWMEKTKEKFFNQLADHETSVKAE